MLCSEKTQEQSNPVFIDPDTVLSTTEENGSVKDNDEKTLSVTEGTDNWKLQLLHFLNCIYDVMYATRNVMHVIP